MATRGVDCQVLLDGWGYFVEPRTYRMAWPRIRKAVLLLDGSERYTDLGPGKRVWHMTMLCLNQLLDYTGAPLPVDGETQWWQLAQSYAKTAALLDFTDLDAQAHRVRFDDMTTEVRDPRTQLTGVSYHVAVTLVEG